MFYNSIIDHNSKSHAPKSENPTLFFPHWRNCPYRFAVRLTWAAMMDLARRGKEITPTAIEQLTGLDRKTIRQAITALEADTLCEVLRGEKSNIQIHGISPNPDGIKQPIRRAKRIVEIELIEPTEAAKCWHAKPGDGWLNQFAYAPIEFSPELSPIENVVLGKLRSLIYMPSDMVLADMVGVERRGVKRIAERLKDRGECATPADDSQKKIGENVPRDRGECAIDRGNCAKVRGECATSIMVLESIKKNYRDSSSVDVQATPAERPPIDVQSLTPAQKDELLDWHSAAVLKKELSADAASVERALNYWHQLQAKWNAAGVFGSAVLLVDRHANRVPLFTVAELTAEGISEPMGYLIQRLKIMLGLAQPPKPKPKPKPVVLEEWHDGYEEQERRRWAKHVKQFLAEDKKLMRAYELERLNPGLSFV